MEVLRYDFDRAWGSGRKVQDLWETLVRTLLKCFLNPDDLFLHGEGNFVHFQHECFIVLVSHQVGLMIVLLC